MLDLRISFKKQESGSNGPKFSPQNSGEFNLVGILRTVHQISNENTAI